MNANEIIKRINEVSNRTALANSDYDFLATHMPFKKLSYGVSNDSEKAKMELSEEDFLDKYIFPNRNEHNMIFVKGNAGSGKSHLIRWFYNKYKNKVDEKEELIILISRDSNSLKGTLNQIVGSELFKGFREEAEFKKIIEAGKFLEEEKLKEDIPALLASSVRTSEIRDIKKRDRDKLANFLSADIIREKVLFRDKGPISRIITSLIGKQDEDNRKGDKIFVKEDFDIVDTNILREMRDTEGDMGASTRAIAFAEDIERNDFKKQEVSDLLNDLIDEVIKKIIGLGRTDLQDVFKKIRLKLKQENMNLTIFFEDITTTTGIHKELLEALLVDNKEVKDLCRIISFVGITENYYTSQIQANIRGRVTHTLEIGDSSLIENKQDLSIFIGLYMNAINQTKENIEEWYNNYSENKNLPISGLNKDKEWSVINLSDERQVSIYPFTEDALWNIYQARDNEGREPRGFLRLIINNIYSNYIVNGQDYLLDMDVYDNSKIQSLKDPLDEEKINIFSKKNEEIKNKTETLIRIWGDGSLSNRIVNGKRTIGNIDEDIFKYFKLPIISGEIIDTELNDTPNDGLISGQKVESSQSDRKMKEYDKEIALLTEWRKGGKLLEHKKYRNFILDLCRNYINWEEEGISRYLIDSLLTASVLNIEGQIVDSSNGVIFKRDDELYYVLIGLINWEYLGEKSWDFDNSHKYILRATKFLNRYKSSIMNLIQKPQGDSWELEDILLINSYYFNMLNVKLKENLSLEDLYCVVFNTSELIKSNLKDGFDDKWIALTNIYNRSDELKYNQDLLIKYFNLPQGIATLKTTGNIEVYAYKILQRIKKLIELNWNIKLYKVKAERSIEIYKPIAFFKNEVVNKIPVLIETISDNIENLVRNLNGKFTEDMDETSLQLMSNKINIYLNLLEETGFINNKEIYDKMIYDTNRKLIYSIYYRLKKFDKLNDIEKLYYISNNEMEILIKYNFNLTKLENMIEEYNKNCEANLKEISDQNLDYIKIIEEIEMKEMEIIGNIERYLR